MEGQSQKSFKLKFNQQLYDYWKNTGIRLFKFTKIDCRGIEKITEDEPAVLTPNHLNWKDIFLTASMISRPISFVASFKLFDNHACYKLLEQHFQIYAKYPAFKNMLNRFNNYLANFLADRVKNLGTIPAKLDMSGSSFTEILSKAFQENKLVCIFPEGGIASQERLRRFKLGVAKILYDYYLENHQSIPAYPIGITGTHKIFYPGMKMGFHVGSPLFIEEFIKSSERQTLSTFIKELQEAVFHLIHSKEK